MRRLLLLLLILLYGSAGISARIWTMDDIRLSWADFQPKVNTLGDGYPAFVSIKLRYKIAPHDDGRHLLFTTEFDIDRSRSRVIKPFWQMRPTLKNNICSTTKNVILYSLIFIIKSCNNR